MSAPQRRELASSASRFFSTSSARPASRSLPSPAKSSRSLVRPPSLVQHTRALSRPSTSQTQSPLPHICNSVNLRYQHSAAQENTQAPQQKACVGCGHAQPLESLSCPEPSCGALQPLPSDIDYYLLMGLRLEDTPRGGWEVDTRALKTNWRKSMGLSHPDRMAGKSEKEQQIGAQQSAIINRAYETLLNPLLRAQYLLERHGAPTVGEADSLEDPELLMEVMELRERLEEAANEEEAGAVRDDNAHHLERTISSLSEAFGSSPPNLEAAREAAVELRYWSNIDKAAREWTFGKRVELQH